MNSNNDLVETRDALVRANFAKCHTPREDQVCTPKEGHHKSSTETIKYIMNQEQVTIEVEPHRFYRSNAAITKNLSCSIANNNL